MFGWLQKLIGGEPEPTAQVKEEDEKKRQGGDSSLPFVVASDPFQTAKSSADASGSDGSGSSDGGGGGGGGE